MLDQKKIRSYDKSMMDPVQAAYYGYSDFYNYGYWTPDTRSQQEACENLVEKLLAYIPQKTGTILDVACGLGATTRHLLKYYSPQNVTAINFSEAQLARARINAPGCNFRYMDATQLDFPDASFDNILCVEAIFHFRTRDKFYREALRVLKPGGRLLATDIKGPRFVWKDNYLERGANTIREKLTHAGYKDIEVLNVTDECWRGFCRNLRRWPGQERRAGRLNLKSYIYASALALLYPPVWGLGINSYYITAAQKPDAT